MDQSCSPRSAGALSALTPIQFLQSSVHQVGGGRTQDHCDPEENRECWRSQTAFQQRGVCAVELGLPRQILLRHTLILALFAQHSAKRDGNFLASHEPHRQV